MSTPLLSDRLSVSTSVQRLKFRLLAEGMTISSQARRALAGENGDKPLTLADYASTSGIAMELEENVWVNAPIPDYNPDLASHSLLELRWDKGRFYLADGELGHTVHPMPPPSYHNQTNSRGVLYTEYAITHTDRVRISPIQGCSYTCKFCDLPYKRHYQLMDVNDCIDAIRRALQDRDLPARHVLISGGTPKPEDWERQNRLYEEVAQAFPNVAIDVMMTASPLYWDLSRVYNAGVHALSINLELYDLNLGKKYMPLKSALSREDSLRFIGKAADLFGPGKVRSLLLVGLEPVEMTLQGVRQLAMRGCDPVLSPFRPDPSTPLKNHPALLYETMERVYYESLEIVEQYGVKLGPRCIPCMHNVIAFPDNSGAYFHSDTHSEGSVGWI